MTINQIVMFIMACGALLGGFDRLLGNRFGFGEKFEKGFQMLGPVALSMAGIICLSPVLSYVLNWAVGPVCSLLHIDPAIFGTLLAIDMGGYQLSMDLARDPQFGMFCGVVISSIFGCNIVYNIPVGLGFLDEESRPYFTRGILLGLTSLPVSITASCLMLGMNLIHVLWNCMPIFVLSLALGIGVIRVPDKMIRMFQGFAQIIRSIATFGLTLAAFTHLSGITLLPGLLSLQEAMKTVAIIGISMLGSMPLAELLQRVMKRPFEKINDKISINGAGTTGLILGMFGATPALALIPQMNRRAQVVISACLVSSINIFGAHFVFANSYNPDMVPAMILAKAVGAAAGGCIAMAATRNLKNV